MPVNQNMDINVQEWVVRQAKRNGLSENDFIKGCKKKFGSIETAMRILEEQEMANYQVFKEAAAALGHTRPIHIGGKPVEGTDAIEYGTLERGIKIQVWRGSLVPMKCYGFDFLSPQGNPICTPQDIQIFVQLTGEPLLSANELFKDIKVQTPDDDFHAENYDPNSDTYLCGPRGNRVTI